MRYRAMHSIAHAGCHSCAPKAWRGVPKLSGDYDLDATIAHRKNKNLPERLAMYTMRRGPGYGPHTAYDAYGTELGGDD